MKPEEFNDPMMKDIEQQTKEWGKLRLGKCTSSRIFDILPGKRGGYLKSRIDYRDECVMGRFGISPEPQYVSKAMERGVECEGFARYHYEQKNGVIVEQTSFIDHPMIPNSGCSPDALIGKNALEIKCPNSGTHFDYIITGVVPEEYKPQMAWQMACIGAEWVDFVSFDDRCPEGLRYFQIRYMRDNDYIAMLESEVVSFNKEVDDRFEILSKKLFEGK